MKKFSSVVGIKVAEEPKIEINKEEMKIRSIKGKLMDLMDNLLKIQSSGSARTELINSAITITGKENLADAIIDMISNQSNSDKIELLESLKFEMNDWFLLDEKIDQYNDKIIQDKSQKDKNIERKIISFLELYSEDAQFELICENFINRITNKSDIEHRLMISESLMKKNTLSEKEKLSILIDKFKKRI